MQVNIGIPTRAVIDILNQLLADEYILLTKTRNYHWHLLGPGFLKMNKAGQYDVLRELIDVLADRVAQLGATATASLRDFLELTRLKEGLHIFEADAQARQLLTDHETVAHQVRTDIDRIENKLKADDPDTVNLLTRFLTEHEKMAWTLRSYLGQCVAV